MMARLNIKPSQYKNFRAWCYKNKDKLDTQDCKHNHGYYTYNVKLVSELYPKLKKQPATTPVEAAEILGNALSTATGRNVTGSDVLTAYERGKDYIRMRRTQARTLLRMRNARRECNEFFRRCELYNDLCGMYFTKQGRKYDIESKTMSRTIAIAIISIILSVISLLINLL